MRVTQRIIQARAFPDSWEANGIFSLRSLEEQYGVATTEVLSCRG